MQGFIQPLGDLSYVTTYTKSYKSVVCTTFTRQFSRRFVDTSNPEGVRPAKATLGDVDPVLQLHFRKAVQAMLQYFDKAHGLKVAAIVCEFIRDVRSCIHLISVLRVEWLVGPNEAHLTVQQSVKTATTAQPQPLKGQQWSNPAQPMLSKQRSADSCGGETTGFDYRLAGNRGGAFDRPDSASEISSYGQRPKTAAERSHTNKVSRAMGLVRELSHEYLAPEPAPVGWSSEVNVAGAMSHGIRGVPRLVNQMAREMQALKDELVFQHEMAEAHGSRVRALEKERDVLASSFAQRLHQVRSGMPYDR